MPQKSSKILVAGSIAYDHLYTFPGIFQNEFVEGAKGQLSIAFNVIEKTVHFGGCGGNIAYNGRLLNEDFILLGIVGKDFWEYEQWLEKHKIVTSHIVREEKKYTSTAVVVTDKKGQQMTFFHEGAAANSKKYKEKLLETIHRFGNELALAHIAPNNKDFILICIDACKSIKFPFIFDPGQALPLFSKTELIDIAENCAGIFFNEYELEFFERRINYSFAEILKMCGLLIVTLGEKGSKIYFEGKEIHVKALKPNVIKDPTGCGDAYRAGFLTGIKNDFAKLTPDKLERAGKLGAKLAKACLEAVGTQNHKL